MVKILALILIEAFAMFIPLLSMYETKLVSRPTTGDVIVSRDGTLIPNIYYSLYAMCVGQNILFSGGKENSIKSWEILNTGELKLHHERKEAHPSYFCDETITALCYSNSLLCSGGESKILSLWRVTDNYGELEILDSYWNAHDKTIRALCFYNNIFFSSGDDCSIRSWSINDQHKITLITEFPSAHNAPIKILISYHNQLISISEDNWIHIWNIQHNGSLKLAGSLLFNEHGTILGMCYTNSGWLAIKFLETQNIFSIKLWQMEDDILRTLTSPCQTTCHRINAKSNCPKWEFSCLACNPPSGLACYGDTIFSLENQFWIESAQIMRQSRPPKKTTSSKRPRLNAFTKNKSASVRSLTSMFKTNFKLTR